MSELVYSLISVIEKAMCNTVSNLVWTEGELRIFSRMISPINYHSIICNVQHALVNTME